MKKYIKSANYGGYHFRYEAHWISPSGNDKLLGGSHTLKGAEQIAMNQAEELFNNPFEDDSRKLVFLESLYLYDSETDKDCTTYDLDDYVDRLMSEIDSRKRQNK